MGLLFSADSYKIIIQLISKETIEVTLFIEDDEYLVDNEEILSRLKKRHKKDTYFFQFIALIMMKKQKKLKKEITLKMKNSYCL
jgi:hypothetical protein